MSKGAPKCSGNILTIRFIALHSINGAPVQLHLPNLQTYNSNREERQAAQEALQLELVRGAQHGRAPQTNTHVNGDPLSVFDDSSLSDVSDDEGRYMQYATFFFASLSLTREVGSD